MIIEYLGQWESQIGGLDSGVYRLVGGKRIASGLDDGCVWWARRVGLGKEAEGNILHV